LKTDFPLQGWHHFPILIGQNTPLSFKELTSAKKFTIEKNFTNEGMSEGVTGLSQEGIHHEVTFFFPCFKPALLSFSAPNVTSC
jgi:hypothetical protein